MCSIISINMNNKIIKLYDRSLLPGDKDNLNTLPTLVPTGGIYLPLSISMLTGIFFSQTNKEQRENLNQGLSHCLLISCWAALPLKDVCDIRQIP